MFIMKKFNFETLKNLVKKVTGKKKLNLETLDVLVKKVLDKENFEKYVRSFTYSKFKGEFLDMNSLIKVYDTVTELGEEWQTLYLFKDFWEYCANV